MQKNAAQHAQRRRMDYLPETAIAKYNATNLIIRIQNIPNGHNRLFQFNQNLMRYFKADAILKLPQRNRESILVGCSCVDGRGGVEAAQ